MLTILYRISVKALIIGDIYKQMSVLSRKVQLYHWRLHGGAEVDLLLERDGVLYPVEVKLGTRLSRKDARGLRMLRETYPGQRLAPGLVIAPVERLEQLTDHDYAVPWDMC